MLKSFKRRQEKKKRKPMGQLENKEQQPTICCSLSENNFKY